ncbi:MAG: acyl carrier protein [Bacteroidales bacterium]|nr:acyl carrier protein [Clostridium sp.]MCM1203851.1 acyl carrier protein [Bacteroidales bacterium]
MSQEEKIAMLEEIMELDEGELKITDKLSDYEEWDSIAVLSFIAVMDSNFHKIVKGVDVKEIITVKDAIDMME